MFDLWWSPGAAVGLAGGGVCRWCASEKQALWCNGEDTGEVEDGDR